MRKIICFTLVLITLLLSACGAVKCNLGETVSTDVVELTVKKAALSYYAESASTSSSTGKTVNIEEAYEPTDNSRAFYKSNKGYTLVCLDFVMKNIDRDSIGNGYVSFSVKQNGKTAHVNGYDLNMKGGDSSGLDLKYAVLAYNGSDAFYRSNTDNKIIDVNESVEIKTVGIIEFDANLDEPFELIAEVKNSDGKREKFIYPIE